jgi:putative colanic acid biosynthesis acetyltransferase WcaF
VTRVDLRLTSNGDFDPGRPFIVRAAWVVLEALILLNPAVTSYRVKRGLLRLFGAHIGECVVIKPAVHVKYPWRLEIGDHAWIGERSWIDNFVQVRIDAHVCVSQGAYLCTGNHDWSDPGMRRFVMPIVVEEGAWIGAFARIAPGVTVGQEAVITLGSVLLTDARPRGIYQGNPARFVKKRRIDGDRAAVIV